MKVRRDIRKDVRFSEDLIATLVGPQDSGPATRRKGEQKESKEQEPKESLMPRETPPEPEPEQYEVIESGLFP